MSYRLELTIHGLPKGTSNANRNWKVRWLEARDWKGRVTLHARQRGLPPEPLKLAALTLVRHSHGRGPDADNLLASFKHILDGLVEAGVLIDDSSHVIKKLDVSWKPCKPGAGHISVIVEELSQI